MSEPSQRTNIDTPASTDDAAFDPPRSIAPVRQLSTRGFFISLALVCLFPLTILSGYAILNGKATEKKLPVGVSIDRRPMSEQVGPQPVLEDVVVIENEADFAITHLYVDLNGQFFMYIDQPLAAGDTLVLPQAGFVNRTSQRWVPGNYAIEEITVMGKLPSGARGVTEFQY